MQIYLVRHGQTGGNVAHRHQVETTQLSFVGEQQVREAAKIIKQYKPTHLVTSNLVRTVETARVIGEACDLIPETNPLFIELVRPCYLYGHHHRSLRSILFYIQWFFGKSTDTEIDGESYQSLRERFVEAEKYLAQFPNDARVVVVSHAVFINLFIAHMCSKKALNPFKAALVFRKILTMPNTHVTPLHFNPENKEGKCAWSVDS